MRILIADSQSMVRSALRLLLEQEPGTIVVGEAANREETEKLLGPIRPDLVLLEWELPGDSIAQLISRCRPAAKVIVVSIRSEVKQLALQSGADFFVCKCDAPDSILAAVRSFSIC
jgi:DNA-binding NarL/FixJ family response regulator